MHCYIAHLCLKYQRNNLFNQNLLFQDLTIYLIRTLLITVSSILIGYPVQKFNCFTLIIKGSLLMPF